MKVIVLFGEKKPKEEDMGKFDKLVDKFLKSLPEDTDVSWYLMRESEIGRIERRLDTFFSSESSVYDINIEFVYKWVPVLREEDKNYRFPEGITSFMRRNYRRPAVYRWNIFRNRLGDEKLIYIGETEELCRRIYQYLNPGRRQRTSKRIRKELENYLNKGFKIELEVLKFDKIKVGSHTIRTDDLEDKHVRRFLEELMTIIYTRKGFQILNL